MKESPSTAFTDALESGDFTITIFMDIDFTSNPLKLTTAPYDVVIGSDTYTSAANILEYTAPSLEDVDNASSYRIRLADQDNSLKARWDALNTTETEVVIKLGLNNNHSDLMTIYEGTIEGVSQEVSLIDNDRSSIISISSPFADINTTTPRKTSKDFQSSIDSTDTCFDDIAEDPISIEVGWGNALGTIPGLPPTILRRR